MATKLTQLNTQITQVMGTVLCNLLWATYDENTVCAHKPCSVEKVTRASVGTVANSHLHKSLNSLWSQNKSNFHEHKQ